MRLKKYLFIFFACFLASCHQVTKERHTPWGTTLDANADTISSFYTFNDILNNGEIIMLTLSGPQTYYEYHGKGLGLQYLLCEKFAQTLGVSLRVEVCKDTTDLVNRLKQGEGDIAAIALPQSFHGIRFCGVSYPKEKKGWAVRKNNQILADTLDHWFKPLMIEQAIKEHEFALSSRSTIHRVYSPMLNRESGIISQYDHFFKKYAPVARMDWRLLAAQCYQESTFDSKAHSWAGACGLMQIMPETAALLGLSSDQLYEPEANIAAAVKYIAKLNERFRDIPDKTQRTLFVLASYNGGYHHIRDAMALAGKHGKRVQHWDDVAGFVLGLREARFYNDPIVKYGYMRGNETVDYVERISTRYNKYRGISSSSFSGVYDNLEPQRAKKKYRFHI